MRIQNVCRSERVHGIMQHYNYNINRGLELAQIHLVFHLLLHRPRFTRLSPSLIVVFKILRLRYVNVSFVAQVTVPEILTIRPRPDCEAGSLWKVNRDDDAGCSTGQRLSIPMIHETLTKLTVDERVELSVVELNTLELLVERSMDG